MAGPDHPPEKDTRFRVLVVGTTADYIDWIQTTHPGRAFFVTRPAVRRAARSTGADPGPDLELVTPFTDPETVARVLSSHLHTHGISVAGVACFDCESLETAAAIADTFGQPFPSRPSIRTARHKYRSKQAWQAASVPCPRAVQVDTPAAVQAFFAACPAGVVLKPAAGSGSELVFDCRTPRACEEAFEQIRAGLALRKDHPLFHTDCPGGIVAEERIQGREFSCDVVVTPETVSLVRITRKISRPLLPFGTATGYVLVPTIDPCLDLDRLKRTLGCAANALGIQQGLCMVDLIWDGTQPFLLELTPRPGGDCLPWLLQQAGGVDTLGLALDVARGRLPDTDLLFRYQPWMGIRIHAPGPGIVSRIDTRTIETDFRVRDIRRYHAHGHVVTMPPRDYDSWVLGHVIAAPDPDVDPDSQALAILDRIHVTMRAPDPDHCARTPASPSPPNPSPTAPLSPTDAHISANGWHPAVEALFRRKQDFLDLASREGSPLYILEPTVLADAATRFRNAFSDCLDRPHCFFAMKCNNLPEVSRLMLVNGFGLEVSSGVELSTAVGLGADRILFNGPGKTDAELSLALDHADRVTLILDSVGEFSRLRAISRIRGQGITTGIRLSPGRGEMWQKFGVMPEDLLHLMRRIQADPLITCSGIQCHTSWHLTPERQTAAIERLGTLLATLPADLLSTLSFLDIGGGYWPEEGEWQVTGYGAPPRHHPAVPIEQFAREVNQALTTHIFPLIRPRIWLEPGRWICHPAMHLLLQVVDKKSPDLVITDAGTNAVGWERFETDYFPVLNLSRSAMTEIPCRILGSLCTPHDVWGYAVFGSAIQEKDYLLIPCQGAYTYSLKQEFIKPLPRVTCLL